MLTQLNKHGILTNIYTHITFTNNSEKDIELNKSTSKFNEPINFFDIKVRYLFEEDLPSLNNMNVAVEWLTLLFHRRPTIFTEVI